MNALHHVAVLAANPLRVVLYGRDRNLRSKLEYLERFGGVLLTYAPNSEIECRFLLARTIAWSTKPSRLSDPREMLIFARKL